MPRKPSWTDDELRDAVRGALSMREVSMRLGLAAGGGTYASLRRHIAKLGSTIRTYRGFSRVDLSYVKHGLTTISRSRFARVRRSRKCNDDSVTGPAAVFIA